MTLPHFFIATLIGWVGVGLFWLFPQKLALLRRVGKVTNDELIRLANAGDSDVRIFRKRSFLWIFIGLLLLLPQVVLLQLAKI